MKISVIIVSFNTKEILKKCLESLEKIRSEIIGEIWVVDNASVDGSPEMVLKDFSKVKLISNSENLGFAKANNLVLEQASGDYFLLLNSDTRVKPDSFDNLVSYIKENSQAGVIGTKLVNPDGSVQPSVFHLPTIWRAVKEYWLGQKGEYEKYTPDGEVPLQVEAVSGAAMLVSKEVFQKIGNLDERYFMYFEDLDFCRRVKRAGFDIYYLPAVKVLHHHGASGKGSSKTYAYLVASSKIYHGIFIYYLIFLVIRIGQIKKNLFDNSN